MKKHLKTIVSHFAALVLSTILVWIANISGLEDLNSLLLLYYLAGVLVHQRAADLIRSKMGK